MIMATRPKISETAILERYRVALENVEAQTEIATIMAEFGYDSALIEEGKNLFNKTRQAYDFNTQEDDETSEAYSIFSEKREQLADTYSLHRKKAKVVFRNDQETLEKLALTGSLPSAYISWLETVKKFYLVATGDHLIQEKLSRLKVTLDNLNATDTLIGEVESARSEYLREKGESQDATEAKDTAFAELDDWMSEFYAVAKIAMEDNIQLLEALGLIIRN